MGKASGFLEKIKQFGNPFEWLLEQPLVWILRWNKRHRQNPRLYYCIKFGFLTMALITSLLFIFMFNQFRYDHSQTLLSKQPINTTFSANEKLVEEMRDLSKQRIGGDPLE